MRPIDRRRVAATALFAICLWAAGPGLATELAAFGDNAAPQVYPFAEDGWTRLAPSLSVNGLPMEVRVVILPENPQQVATRFRIAWGEPLLSQRSGSSLALSRALTEHFVTVQLSPADGGHTRAVVSAVSLDAIGEPGPANRPVPMPAGSQLITDTQSRDLDTVSRYLVYANQSSLTVNRDFLVRSLAGQQLQLEREQRAALQQGEGLMLMFAGPSAEAVAVLHRRGLDSVATVNFTSRLETLQ